MVFNENISDRDYIRLSLEECELVLKEQEIKHRINVAVYNKEKELLEKQIKSLEYQKEADGDINVPQSGYRKA